MRLMISALTGAALGIVPGLGAQQKTPAPRKEPAPSTTIAPERTGCFTTDGNTECRFIRREGLDSALMKRAAIGVQLSPTGTARDTLGVFISRVTPKGPAENAGIVEGDRIVSINGVDLKVNPADAGDSYAAGLPSRRLTREVAKLTPGSVADIRVYSGGRVRDVKVTLGRASDLRERGSFGMLLDGASDGAFRMMPGIENLQMRLREMPRVRMREMDLPRMRQDYRDLPKMRMEEMELPRMRVDELLDRVRVEERVNEKADKVKAEKKKQKDKDDGND